MNCETEPKKNEEVCDPCHSICQLFEHNIVIPVFIIGSIEAYGRDRFYARKQINWKKNREREKNKL